MSTNIQTHTSELEADNFLARANESSVDERAILNEILQTRLLTPLFQPIVSLANARVIGHEALIRGPQGPLHMPAELFGSALSHDVLISVEHLCHQTIQDTYASKQPMASKLFLNASPQYMVSMQCQEELSYERISAVGLKPQNIVLELTENASGLAYSELREVTDRFRSMGYEIAMDDLGEGFSSLRLWSELQPDYVKLDKHFIRDIHTDRFKLEFVKSIQRIAENSGAKVIAEGIETIAELTVVNQLKIDYGQGYLLGRPISQLNYLVDNSVANHLSRKQVSVLSSTQDLIKKKTNLSKLVKYVPPVSAETNNNHIFEIFDSNPGLYSIAVIEGTQPVGLISRYTLIDSFAKPYSREIFGKKSCKVFMDAHPLVVELDMSLHALSDLITNMEPHHLTNGFIVTQSAKYLGLGSGHDLLREITQMQIKAARYANPLTLLPGNVPIHEHVDYLLSQKIAFCICYCDLDHFKPFNDAYGFDKGDDVIKFTGKLITSVVSAELDFVGHVGGDDFIIVFQSEDWQQRCQNLLDSLTEAMPSFYDPADVARNGIEAKDRQGNTQVYPLGTMSIGAVQINSQDFSNHYEVFGAVSRAKKQAKVTSGNSIFLERRTHKFDMN